MRLYTGDDDLNAFARGADLLTFRLTDEDHAHFMERWRASNLLGVSPFPDGRSFRVRLYLGGKQRILGILANGAKAARYADMARLHFWGYRLRGVRLPHDTDFNYGLDATKAALATEDGAQAVEHLDRIKGHLSACGELKERTLRSQQEGAEAKEERDMRRTVRGELLFIQKENTEKNLALEKALLELKTAVEGNVHLFNQIKQAFQHILERLPTKPLDNNPPSVENIT